jgi:CubicO group peptidase (beta-lactamase class C family)
MTSLSDIRSWLDANLAQRLEKHQVPGANLAVYQGGQVIEAAAGLLSLDTGVEATTDAVFQIGSITKVLTTSLVMQLVDSGAVDLDAPVRRYLPEFRVADADASAAITVRQLMTHTSGFEGDLFIETTKEDDAVERFVADVLPTVAQPLAPGTLFSYNNAGFVVLGRIVEVLRGKPYVAVLRERLADPLGMSSLCVTADEAILHRAAVGHVKSEADGQWHPVKVWGLAHSNTPAGATPNLPAGQLINLARLHLSGGLAPDGTRLLSEESVAAMRQPQVDVPRRTRLDSRIGLAWHLFDTADGVMVSHDGGTLGQIAFLGTWPDRDLAVAVLTNGGNPAALLRDVAGHILSELGGASLPPELELPETPAPVDNPERYVGRYTGRLSKFEVTEVDGGLSLTIDFGDLAAQSGAERYLTRDLVRVDGEIFACPGDDGAIAATFAFIGSDDSGRARFLHNHRANPRVE